MTDSHPDWVPTKTGGFRRVTPQRQVAQVGKTGTLEESSGKVEGSAGPEAGTGEEASQYLGERSPNTGEGGGSIPPLPTKKSGRSTKKVGTPPAPPPTNGWVLKFNEHLGLPTCPYLIRWRLETPWGSVRLHHWLGPDDDRAKHDHPWSFVTFVIRGGYTDLSPSGDTHLRAPKIQYRDAKHQHTVVPDADGAWTILLTGPKIRHWGFWVQGKFRKANRYFSSHGHHPCQ